METGLTKNAIISELCKTPHGKLEEYIPVGRKAAEQDPDFFSHLIAWDRKNGQVRDSKVALPVVSMTVKDFPAELLENSLAHMALLGPREMGRGFRFMRGLCGHTMQFRVKGVIERWLREKEGNRREWNRIAIQHRKTLKELYALPRIKPSADADAILFKGQRPEGSVFDVVARLKDLPAEDAAAEIVTRKIPFLVAQGALGKRVKDSQLLLAIMSRMTPTELVTNTKMLEKWGVKTDPVLRGAFEEALKRASSSKANVLKTTRAVDAVKDETLKDKLRGLQDRQLQNMGVDGNWLVLADKSGSMDAAIEVARQVAATLAKMVKGKVWLVFFDTTPLTVDVTGLTLDMIQKATAHIRAVGGTSIGCGLQRMLDEKADIDGIAVVSDGGENNTPYFAEVYPKYSKMMGKDPTVYLYHCGCRDRTFTAHMQRNGLDMQVFDLGGKIDYYSLPNLVRTMRTNRYSLVDEVMSAKLLTLDEVFKSEREEELAHA